MTTAHWKTSPGRSEVARLRHAVTDYAVAQGLRGEVVDDVRLAVSEVVANAVMHAYPDGGEGFIDVTATIDGERVLVRVVDNGVGLGPRLDSAGAGLGLAIAGHLARRITVERPARGGTEVRMLFGRTS